MTVGQTVVLTNKIIFALLQGEVWDKERLCKPWDPSRLYICGLREAERITDTSVQLVKQTHDRYNDSIVLFGKMLRVFKASVDPGKTFTETPLEGTEGCAHLLDGRWTYKKGLHLPSVYGRRKPALIQANKVQIWRDYNNNYLRDPSEENPDEAETYPGYFGINIHAGGAGEKIGANSAGCQIIHGGWDGEPWKAFKTAVYGCGQVRFEYYLVNGHALSKYPPDPNGISTSTKAKSTLTP